MGNYERHCAACLKSHGAKILLQQDPSGFWACPRCGLVNEGTTSARALVDFNEHGIQVDDDVMEIKNPRWSDWREAKFEEHVNDLLNLYLGMPDVRTGILGLSGESIRTTSRKWLDRILEAERVYYQQKLGHRKAGPKTKFRVLIAIKMALDESALIVINNRLKSEGLNVKTREFSGSARGDERLPILSIQQISERASKYPVGSFGHIDHERYLLVLYRRFTRLLRNTPTPLEATLMYTSEILQRLRIIMDTPHAERGPLLLTKPQVGKTHREWAEEEFQFFENLDWTKILPQAFHLYRLQECVYLWGPRSSPNVAIALTLWAIQAVKKEIVPSFSLLMEELAAPYGQQKWVAQERFKEMRNLLVAWSTSIVDAGLTFPLLPLPPKGVIGDGVAGYGSDHRRGIPEMDMAVAVLPIISKDWRRILKARFRTRCDAMPLSDEVYLARKMFVLRCEAYATLLDPKASISPHLQAAAQERGPGRANPAIKKFKAYAEQARKEINAFEPLIRVRINPIVGSLEIPDNAHLPNPEGVPDQREQSSLSVQTLSVEGVNSPEGEVNEDQFTTIRRFSPPRSVQSAIASTANELEMERDQSAPQTDDRSTTLALAASRQSIPASRGQSASSNSSATGRMQRVYPAPPLRSSPPPSIYTAPPTPLIQVPDSRTPSSRMPFSRTGSSARQNNRNNASDDAHIGILIRERDEYIKFRYSTYLETGHVVNPVCEAFMWQWLHRQVDNKSMPTTITAEYLSSIGIKDDPRRIDLGPWIESKKDVWSPVECLLRAGIKPNEIPQQHVSHSLLHLKLLLYMYPGYQSGMGVLAPVGEGIDDNQLEKELDLLFDKEGGDCFETILLSPSEVDKRKKEYRKMGVFGDEEDINAWRGGHIMRPVQAATHFEEGEDEEQSADEDYFAPIPIPSPSRTRSPQSHSPAHEVENRRHVVQQDIERIRSAATRKSKDELEALLKSLGEGEDLDAEAEKYEALLGGIVVNEADMGLGFDEDEHDEEDDGGKKKKKGRGKDVSNTTSKRKKSDEEKGRKGKKSKTA
ncbi:hypothetical protein C351_01437 [Cryptococcus neoformans c8]|nr:hypothetical protein C353_01598 [Cryptococcus neoformans var. grubii AD1-83a]OXG65205.1 hypothetical protein C354_01611 [Cryptococcus neoformans var. grubii MW-RSA1955]OXG67272.1 hypothetical protein C351_01437 [Cryptococcus neoformans var. grubii c8]OXG70142.1 hypothetical protein C352_01614 [Cryptococcus neoformans var. grubii CHC193]OXH15840.1 hypothetical protein C369_01585 [Cryptococcus neoformans var. grubii A5-35-17]OXH17442.1 hypothetical protein C370_01591 [Cryptococcus neoformans 